MKHLLMITTLCLIGIAKAQTKTSFDEYNYVTNSDGLKRDLSASRGIKDGYSLEMILGKSEVKWADGRYKTAKAYYFKKGNDNKAVVVILLDEKGNTNYICIPGLNSDQSIWDLSYHRIESLGDEWMDVFSLLNMKLISSKLLL